ncbi:hypothetical protein I3842_06G059700 [Carya illinoinensis]|uniref:Uncharacterized protein n=1 Tax=Carya illinoinensis TaxID=32201 RepID=A0A922EQ28_CARIL|nr:hypothetical protein I3842_06G059700 [Carya illinoinensis]
MTWANSFCRTRRPSLKRCDGQTSRSMGITSTTYNCGCFKPQPRKYWLRRGLVGYFLLLLPLQSLLLIDDQNHIAVYELKGAYFIFATKRFQNFLSLSIVCVLVVNNICGLICLCSFNI